jgi:hypothetical protein
MIYRPPDQPVPGVGDDNDFQSSGQPRSRLPAAVSHLGPDGEIYGNAGFSFDGLTGFEVRLESPLLHRFPCRSGKNRGAAEYLEVLNSPVPSDQNMQHDCALNFHLLGQQGIVRFNRA